MAKFKIGDVIQEIRDKKVKFKVYDIQNLMFTGISYKLVCANGRIKLPYFGFTPEVKGQHYTQSVRVIDKTFKIYSRSI